MKWISLFAFLYMSVVVPARCEAKTDIRDVVGASHIHGVYSFTDGDFINEGADRLLELGTRVVKLAFRDHMEGYYPFNSKWPEITSLTQLAETPYMRAVFEKPFKTYVLMTFTPGKDIHYFTKGMTPEDIERERDSFADITRYLLTRYKGSGKTFILQNWESDWVLTPSGSTAPPDPKAIKGMIDWFNARQDGVDRARREVGMHGVSVLHAAEVNLLRKAMEGKPCVTNSVLPHTHCDLYSYSAWDTVLRYPDEFGPALDYLATKAPDSKLFGNCDIYVGEYGAAEYEIGGGRKQLELVRRATETALQRGARYVIYWQLFCDGPKHELTGRPTNEDCWGLRLVRPDGSKAPVWYYFHKLLSQ